MPLFSLSLFEEREFGPFYAASTEYAVQQRHGGQDILYVYIVQGLGQESV
jgi:hypothetical protein